MRKYKVILSNKWIPNTIKVMAGRNAEEVEKMARNIWSDDYKIEIVAIEDPEEAALAMLDETEDEVEDRVITG